MTNIEKLQRRLDRLNSIKESLEKTHKGNELNYTYWGGYELGYLKGKICELENIIEYFGESLEDDDSGN